MIDFEKELDETQLAAVQHGGSPLLVLAGPGSGKTRVLTYRIAHIMQKRGIHPRRIFAVTFTNKAAGEMKDRLGRLVSQDMNRGWIGTFHSMCARLLRQSGQAIGVASGFQIADSDQSTKLVARALEELGYGAWGRDSKYKPKVIAGKITLLKDEGMNAQQIAERAYLGPLETYCAKVFPYYQRLLRDQGFLDFSDLIQETTRLLEFDISRGGELVGGWDHILVDEFQDTNQTQYNLVKLLAVGGGEVAVVGDDDQGIYSWRGARPANILGFPDDFPGAKKVVLRVNYRSTAALVAATSSMITHNSGRYDKEFYTHNELGRAPEIFEAKEEKHEAFSIASRIQDLVKRTSYEYSDVAILVRIGAQSREIEQAMLAASIPYRMVGGARFFDRKEVKDMMCFVRLMLNKSSDEDFERVVNVPPRGIGKATIERLREHAKQNGTFLMKAAWDLKDSMTPRIKGGLDDFFYRLRVAREDFAKTGSPDLVIPGLMRTIARHLGYAGRETVGPEEEERAANVEELILLIEDMVKDGRALDLNEVVNEVSLSSDPEEAEDKKKPAVSISTVHAAKGLEWRGVFLAGVEEGILPSKNAQSRGEIEEERRVFYVALTRAKDFLHVSYCGTRLHRGLGWNGGPSVFVDELESAIRRGHGGLRLLQ